MRPWLGVLFLAACADPLTPHEGEQYPGGTTTNVFLFGAQAFTQPAANLSSDRRAPFFSGNAFFNQAWVTAPSSTTARDGLGPLFNAAACSTCHFRDGRSAPPDEGGTLTEVLVRLSSGNDADGAPIPDPIYGGQLQPFATAGAAPEARPEVRWETVEGSYADGTAYALRRPVLTLVDPAYGAFAPNLRTGVRAAPHLIGLGLLEAIAASQLEAWADPDDLDGDGIRGEVQILADGSIGRFGWKAEQPTVRHQTAGAFHGDMGLTSSLFPEAPCTESQTVCREAPSGGDPEVDDPMLERVTFYAMTLAPPARREVAESDVLRGRELFARFGCASCHVPSVTTGELEGFPELSNQRIWPHTDLLLHDLGPELAEDHAVHRASGSEWRTPPLWGLGFLPQVSGHLSLLHDGRARGFAEAILWHGGEAEASREAFRTADAAERAELVRYLESL